jgi:hypothetical protein
MDRRIYVDPGKRKSAFAEFEGGGLSEVRFADSPYWPEGSAQVWVELPQQRGRGSRTRVQDLIDLAFSAGQHAGPTATPVKVSQWKGSESKDSMHTRMWEVLSEDETMVLQLELAIHALGVRHNLLDAVCFGLVMLRRM